MVTLNTDIFNNVAKHDYLSLLTNGRPKYQRVVQFLEFKKEDVSKAAGVPLGSIRYDAKIPTDLHERIREWANVINLVAGHFAGDATKTTLWFTTINPLLGDLSPRDMIRFGRYKKLLKFIVSALAENKE